MEIIYELHGNTMIAELYGEMDHHGAEKIRHDIDEMIGIYDAKHLIFDFGKVNFMDSAGIGVILGRYRKLKQQGGEVLLVRCGQRIRSILHMAGVFSVIPYMDSREEAIAHLERKEVS